MTGGDRGTTRIADRVVARIATRAAAETGRTGGVDRTVLGMSVGRGRAPRAEVAVHGRIVTARIEMSVAYPEPVREVAHRVREHVRARVEELTGLTVRQVDVDVSALEREAVIGTSRRRTAGRRPAAGTKTPGGKASAGPRPARAADTREAALSGASSAGTES